MRWYPRCSAPTLPVTGHDPRCRVVYACVRCGRHVTRESLGLVSGHRLPRDHILIGLAPDDGPPAGCLAARWSHSRSCRRAGSPAKVLTVNPYEMSDDHLLSRYSNSSAACSRSSSTNGLVDACPPRWHGQRRSRGLASSNLPNTVRKTMVLRSLTPRVGRRSGRARVKRRMR
jgi:hypothetical protein